MRNGIYSVSKRLVSANLVCHFFFIMKVFNSKDETLELLGLDAEEDGR